MDIDLVLFTRGLINEATKLTDLADPKQHSEFLIHMTAAQVCASIAQALLNAHKPEGAA